MLHIGWLIGGIMVVEAMFGYPGIGTLLVKAAMSKDVPIIEAGALLMTFVATATQLLADFTYIYLNPRIRYIDTGAGSGSVQEGRTRMAGQAPASHGLIALPGGLARKEYPAAVGSACAPGGSA